MLWNLEHVVHRVCLQVTMAPMRLSLGGCIGTANCLAEMKYGPDVKAVGTVAHSYIEILPNRDGCLPCLCGNLS